MIYLNKKQHNFFNSRRIIAFLHFLLLSLCIIIIIYFILYLSNGEYQYDALTKLE